MKYLIYALLVFGCYTQSIAQDLTALHIVKKAEDKRQGDYSQGELKMTIVRPDWSRDIQLKMWSEGTKNSLILVTGPARDKGTAFLKRDKEMWNWQPKIDRTIKMPPSMMSQSWMGSDFTNDDLAKESSIVEDYTHKILEEETLDTRKCWKLELKPKENAAVVWGKIILWIDQKDFILMKAEYYDEDNYLVNTMTGKKIKMMDGRLLPSILEIVPADEEGQLTRLEYLSLKFDEPIKDGFFSLQNLKRIK